MMINNNFWILYFVQSGEGDVNSSIPPSAGCQLPPQFMPSFDVRDIEHEELGASSELQPPYPS